LRAADINGGWGPWGPLKNWGAALFSQEGRDPGDQVAGDTALPQDAGKSGVVDVVEPCFDVQKQGRDLEAGSLKGFHIVEKGRDRIIGAPSGQGAALVGVQHAL